MSLRGAIEALRGRVPPVPAPANHGEPLEAPETKEVPPVPWVPPEKTKSKVQAAQEPQSRPKGANGEIVDFQSSREPGNLTPTPAEPIRRAVVRFKLIGNQGGGSLLGDFGDTAADLVEELQQCYGTRLESVSQ